MAEADIGCSLAEAAEAPAYANYLAAAAAEDAPALHVVYINTSLRTKALAHAAVPTITCTSSNVVATVLQVRSCFILLMSCSCLPAPPCAVRAGACVPTITCTSSSMLSTLLQVCLACPCLHAVSELRMPVSLHLPGVSGSDRISCEDCTPVSDFRAILVSHGGV